MKNHFKLFLSLTFLLCTFASIGQYTILHYFNGTAGTDPASGLTPSGNIVYGVTGIGGANNDGCIFSMHIDGSNYKDIFDFNGTDGQYPNGGLTLSGGILYGTASQGGSDNDGVIFSIDTNGSGYKVLLNLNGTNGMYVYCTPVISGNILYGTALEGGKNGDGIVYSLNTNGTGFKDLHDFNNTDGEYSSGSLTLSGNKLYGTTEFGGANSKGVVYTVDINGNNFKKLLDFNGTNGDGAAGALIRIGKTLYGVTGSGGSNGMGNVFSVDTTGNTYKDLIDFNSSTARGANGGLLLSGGKFYGTSGSGGIGGGIVYSIDTNGSNFEDLLPFQGNVGGGGPGGPLIISSGLLYGTAGGGPTNNGIIYSLDTAGAKLMDSISIVSPIHCFGDSTGEITVTGYGGVLPYSYVWTPGPSSNGYSTLYGLKAGKYKVAIIDSRFDTIFDSITLRQPPLMQLTTSSALSSCKPNNGLAKLSASGGVKPYNFVWTPNVSNDSVASGLGIGYYTCTVTDSAGCSHSRSFTIKDSNAPNFNAITTRSTCYHDSNGTAIITPTSGVNPFTFKWAPYGGTNASATNLIAGNYTVTVTDSNNCKTDSTITITQPPVISVESIAYGADTGINSCATKIVLYTSGGVPPYTYLWNIGDTSDSITNLCLGKYCFNVTDSNGCVSAGCITVYRDSTVGLPTITANKFSVSVYPNPSNGKFSVVIKNGAALVNSNGNNSGVNNYELGITNFMEVYNTFGQIVRTYSFSNVNSVLPIDLSDESNGIYFYRIINTDKSSITSGKLEVQH